MPLAPPAWRTLSVVWWGMTPEESTQLWGALARARWSRPVALRQRLALGMEAHRGILTPVLGCRTCVALQHAVNVCVVQAAPPTPSRRRAPQRR